MGGAVAVVVIIAGLIEYSQCQCQEAYQLEFLLKSSDPYGFGIKRTSAESDDPGNQMLPSVIRTCDKLCAVGMWAMYTKPNYGIDAENTTAAYPVQGAKESDCTTSPINSILRGIFSIRSLGGTDPEMNGYSYFPTAYFIGKKLEPTTLGGMYKATADGTAPPLRSLAIAIGSTDVTTKSYTICPKPPGNCFCFDESKGSSTLMVPDTKTFPSAAPFKDTVCSVMSAATMCPMYGLIARPSTEPC